jgi:hypothetical protein
MIPIDKIMKVFGVVQDAVNDSTKAAFSTFGFGSSSVIKNLGMYFLAALGLILIVGLILLLKFLSTKNALYLLLNS